MVTGGYPFAPLSLSSTLQEVRTQEMEEKPDDWPYSPVIPLAQDGGGRERGILGRSGS